MKYRVTTVADGFQMDMTAAELNQFCEDLPERGGFNRFQVETLPAENDKENTHEA